jgi:hypothetical protein
MDISPALQKYVNVTDLGKFSIFIFQIALDSMSPIKGWEQASRNVDFEVGLPCIKRLSIPNEYF